MPYNEKPLMELLAAELERAISAAFAEQGHSLTGAAERSIKGKYSEAKNRSEMIGTALEYMATLDDGLTPSEYRRHYPNAASQIKALAAYVTKRTGLIGDKAMKAGFAIYRAHLREGMPTLGSYQFSQTADRTDFLETAELHARTKMGKIFDAGMDALVDEQYNKQKSETI